MHQTIESLRPTQSYAQRMWAGVGGAVRGVFSSRLLVTVLVLGLTVATSSLLVVYRTEIEGLGRLGYVGVVAIAAMGNAIIAVPFPWLLVIAPLGRVYSPVWLALFAALGASLGSLLPYALGRSVDHQKLPKWVSKALLNPSMLKKTLVVVGLAFSPVFSYPTLAAGFVRYPLYVTLLITFVVEGAKVLLVAYAARFGLQFIGL